MHELSLCRRLIKIINEKIIELDYHSKRVTAIWLEADALSGVDIKSLEFYFTILSRNTAADKARLHIKTVPSKAQCADCKNAVNIESFLPCPMCGHFSLIIEPRSELIIKSMEVG